MQSMARELTEQLGNLTPAQFAKVKELVASMQDNSDALILSEASFARIWDDPENDVYDAL